MSAKKVMSAAILSVLLTACGAQTPQATLPADGTYGSTSLTSADASGAAASDTSYPDTTDSSGTSTLTDASGTTTPAASATVPANGYTFAGIVTDQSTGQPLANAMVSIGASTLLTKSDGSFSFTGIMDPTITVAVSLTGYAPLQQQTVTLSGTVVQKSIQLAPTDSGATSTGDSTGTATPTASFRQAMSFSSSFQSVADMLVVDNKVYVLGMVDPTFGFDHSQVNVYDATTGQQLENFAKIGFLSHLPKSANSLAVDNGQVKVSDGTTTYLFDASGNFLTKGTAGSPASPATTATDSTNDRTYTLKGGNQVDVTTGDGDTLLTLPGVTNAVAVGVSSTGNLLVLDGTSNTVLGFTYLPAQ
ncbi:MAG TPA: carboxypeptidase regulatory-like domain-containing protein [Oscillatoriaceae cyanobacterium]